jgi:hypothetical protein
MKITKNRLKQIIKEEVRSILEGDKINFPVDRVSDKTYKGEGEVIELPDPLKDMIEYFDLDKDMATKLRKLIAGPLAGKDENGEDIWRQKIFDTAAKMDITKGIAKERVPLAIDAFYNEYFKTE